MPAVKDVGEPCEGEPHARFDGGREETNASRLIAARRPAPPAYPTATALPALLFLDLCAFGDLRGLVLGRAPSGPEKPGSRPQDLSPSRCLFWQQPMTCDHRCRPAGFAGVAPWASTVGRQRLTSPLGLDEQVTAVAAPDRIALQRPLALGAQFVADLFRLGRRRGCGADGVQTFCA